MTAFPDAALRKWVYPFEKGDTIRDDGAFRVAIDDGLDESERIQILTRPSRTCVIMNSATAQLPGLRDSANEAELRISLAAAGVAMNGADHLFFVPDALRRRLAATGNASNVRQLTSSDATSFAAFQESAPDQDQDDAFVELDHWVVFGAFDGDTLVAAGSAYPDEDVSTLADMGVLTLPDHRGRGHAREVVFALARHLLRLEYEPQYRCQLDNVGSVALAQSAGFVELGTWDAPLPDDDQDQD